MHSKKKAELKADLLQMIDEADELEFSIISHLMQAVKLKSTQKNTTYINTLFQFHTTFHEAEETLEISMPVHDIVLNTLNMTHGGVTATLLDTAMGVLVNRLLPTGKKAVTTEIKVNYLAPGIGEHLTCKAEAVQMGTKLCVTEGRVYRSDGKLIAIATGSFYVIKER